METIIFWAPLLLNVLGQVIYNVVGKSTPSGVNTFASLTITYLTGFVICVALFYFNSGGVSIIEGWSHANWTALLLALGIIGVDLSLIMLFRAGWDISIGTLVANIGMSLITVCLGVAIWGESMNVLKLVGIVVCLVGLYVVNKPQKEAESDSAETADAEGIAQE